MSQPPSDQEEAGEQPAVDPLFTQPKILAFVAGLLVLLVGIPAGLYAATGRTTVALGLVALFIAMVVVTAAALKVASEAERS